MMRDVSEPARDEQYAIAVIGGATAGAEAASIFSERGILTAVFEQNARPYGKIEDGLPRWHVELRHQEYQSIDEGLSAPHVHFVPRTKLGRDLDLGDLARGWGFHAVVLANGAWRDRPLPLEGADAFVGRGLVYQNPFIYWFNHYPEAGYDGPRYEIADGTIVVGGGLASIDVVKAIQLELTQRGLRARGIEQDLVELETQGIPAALERRGLAWKDLGFRGCTLYYRRRLEDMPLVELPQGASDAVREKIERSRRRVLEKAVSKYLFAVEPLRAPVGLIVEGERLAGLRFARSAVEGGRLRTTDEITDVRAPLVISSIGSIPEPIPGIPEKGELYAFEDLELGRLADYATLFSAGNVVTGKGNIVASRKHSRRVCKHLVERYLGLVDSVTKKPPLAPGARDEILRRVRELQARVRYSGDYRAWIRSVTPPDLV
jgi:NADPH-dependent glutamate synthase beta subunit-like oxidoreductase